MADKSSSISVCVRVRPFTVREAAQLAPTSDGPLFLGDGSLASAPMPRLVSKGIRPVIKVVDDKCLVFDPPDEHAARKFSRVPTGKRSKDQTFGFDRIFDENVTQADVYEGTTKHLLDSVLDGYNATVFAYGATGCGKTHTITGTVQQPGIIFLTMQELFERITERSDEKVCEVTLSYLEIYNETIRDLLVPGTNKQGLMLREDSKQAVSVAGLSSHHPQSVEEVMEMIVRGNEYRTMSPTEANATSSRSHAVLQINISEKDRNASIDEPHTMATLSIIDLAGSERASATKNRGERLTEGANINKSLLALGSCINALCDARKSNHIPYRNSKLTRLLKFSLGGNCKTVMIVCVSPSSAHFDETQNTLRYANRAKNIQTKVTRNVYNVNRHVKDFLIKIDEQILLINELKAQQKDYETVALAKFRKQNDKRETVAREGIARIQNAYEHASVERLEKVSNTKNLRQLERRIAMLSSWVSAFDQVSEMQEDDSLLGNLQAMRKTAQGVMIELEGSRHHYRQKISKSNWERSVDSALQTGLRQLADIDGEADAYDSDTLTREAEFLKANAEREALVAVAELDKAADASMVQVLLKAHFETMAAVQNLISMDEGEAVQAAQGILRRILQGASDVTSHVVKPDGKMIPVESFPPSKSGTPKRKKQANFLGGIPLSVPKIPALAAAPYLAVSPMRLSPKRKKFGSAKKGVQFTPKKSPAKNLKRVVRWRDDSEEGVLADFEKTPQKIDPSPEPSPVEQMLPPPVPDLLNAIPAATDIGTDSSPIPPPPETTADIKPKSDRFKSGFLAKKSSGSPLAAGFNSSDSDYSPLRDLEPGNSGNKSAHINVMSGSQDGTHLLTSDSGSNLSSDAENHWAPEKTEAMKVKTAMKRMSIGPGATASAMRTQRRRSPIGPSSGSPPNENMFTASHARRMVRSEKENDFKGGVLSPRTSAIAKIQSRRITMSGDSRASLTPGVQREAGVRLSNIAPGGAGARGSLLSSKGAWR